MSCLSELLQYALETYATEPEHLWESNPVMKIPRRTLGLPGKGNVDILDVKCSPVMIGSLTGQPGYLPAYHMNKTHWITILPDGTVPFEEVAAMLDLSYQLTRPKMRRAKRLSQGE